MAALGLLLVMAALMTVVCVLVVIQALTHGPPLVAVVFGFLTLVLVVMVIYVAAVLFIGWHTPLDESQDGSERW
jgi:hypothetical protein